MTYILLILAFGFAYTLFRIGRDIFRSYQCLDEDMLRDFLYRRIPRNSSTYRQVISHLGQCEECQEKLREIQRGKRLEDHLVD